MTAKQSSHTEEKQAAVSVFYLSGWVLPVPAVFWEITPTWCPSLAHAWVGPFPSLMWFDSFGRSQENGDMCPLIDRLGGGRVALLVKKPSLF